MDKMSVFILYLAYPGLHPFEKGQPGPSQVQSRGVDYSKFILTFTYASCIKNLLYLHTN